MKPGDGWTDRHDARCVWKIMQIVVRVATPVCGLIAFNILNVTCSYSSAPPTTIIIS